MHHVWLEFVQERWYEVKLNFQIVDLSNIQEQTLPRPLPKAVAEPQTSSDNKERSRLTNQSEEEREEVLTDTLTGFLAASPDDIQHAARRLRVCSKQEKSTMQWLLWQLNNGRPETTAFELSFHQPLVQDYSSCCFV